MGKHVELNLLGVFAEEIKILHMSVGSFFIFTNGKIFEDSC